MERVLLVDATGSRLFGLVQAKSDVSTNRQNKILGLTERGLCPTLYFIVVVNVYIKYMFDVTMVRKNEKIDWKYNLSEYWGFLKKHKTVFYGMLFSALIVELMRIVPRFLFKEIVDRGTDFVGGVVGAGEFSFVLAVVAGLYVLSNAIQTGGIWAKSYLLAILDSKMMSDVKEKYFKHILSLDHNFHTTHKTGSLISRLGRGVSSIENLDDNIAFNLLPLLLQLIIVGFSLAYFSMASALTVAAIAVCFVIYGLYVQKIQEPSKLRMNSANDIEKGNVGDVFTNVDSIKYFGKEKLIFNKFKKLVKNTEKANLKYWSYFRQMDTGLVSIIVVGTLLILYFPLMKFLAGEISMGSVVFIYTVYGNLMGPLWSFVYGMRGLYRSMADFQELFEYGKIEKDIKDKAGARNINIRKGHIEFRDIDFAYKKRKIFADFNLNIEANKKIAFVGHSGCGKSTLINLLYRFYDVNKGAVLIDGVDVRDVRQESLRSSMSIVPQECVLFDDTIWNNIRFSNPKASSAEVRKAIKFAQLDKIIAEMPEGERTVVGERGVKLSGGEKQRVSIARAILADKKILVLDEATSALDSETEFEIQRDLAKLMKGRTSIIIAHRLSTIMHADRIVVMKRGRIVESGTHDELLRMGGEYKRLWGLQKGGYIK